MRISWLVVSIAVHGAAIGAAIGFATYACPKKPLVPAELRLQSQVASVPSVAQEVPLPDVVPEDVVPEDLVEELSVPDVQLEEPEVVETDEPESAQAPAAEEAALAAVQVAPSPSEILQQATASSLKGAELRREAAKQVAAEPQPDEAPAEKAPAEEVPVAAEAQPQVAAPPQAYVKAQRADNEPPRYPDKERRLGREGKVVVRVTLDSEGNVERATLLEPSRYPGFNRAALEAVRRWHFTPATMDGLAVASETDIEVLFRLTSDV